MTYTEFLQNCKACGGNWGAMLLTGIKRVFPDEYESVKEKYNSMDFSDGGVKAFGYLYDWLEEHGVHKEVTSETPHAQDVNSEERSMPMYYYACGEKVPEVEFIDCDEAWKYTMTHEGYDCVVEHRHKVKRTKSGDTGVTVDDTFISQYLSSLVPKVIELLPVCWKELDEPTLKTAIATALKSIL